MVKVGCICAKWLYSGEMVVLGKSGCIWAKVVVLKQNRGIRAKMAVFG